MPPIKKTGDETGPARANRPQTPTRQGTLAGQDSSAAAGGESVGGGSIFNARW